MSASAQFHPESPHMFSRPGRQFASKLQLKSLSLAHPPRSKSHPVLLPPDQLIARLDEQEKEFPASKQAKARITVQASPLFQTQSRQDYYQATVRAI